MPQLIAMIIVVVGAMIYMFQTFGGTGDKIEGIAQKTSIITEINNIKNGLKLAGRNGTIAKGNNDTEGEYNTLTGLAKVKYFAEQINEQLSKDSKGTARGLTFNSYSAISFGGDASNAEGTGGMLIQLVANKSGQIPGIYVDLSKGNLKDNAGFLESQIASDLENVAIIDRKAANTTFSSTTPPAAGDLRTGTTLSEAEKRTPVASTTGSDSDGMFTIYFQDFGSNEVVKTVTAVANP